MIEKHELEKLLNESIKAYLDADIEKIEKLFHSGFRYRLETINKETKRKTVLKGNKKKFVDTQKYIFENLSRYTEWEYEIKTFEPKLFNRANALLSFRCVRVSKSGEKTETKHEEKITLIKKRGIVQVKRLSVDA
jgi:hypothetical protein